MPPSGLIQSDSTAAHAGETVPESCTWEALTLSRVIHARDISCREVMAAFLGDIEAVDPRVNAIVSMRDGDVLLQEADRCDAELAQGASRGWLHVIPQPSRTWRRRRGCAPPSARR